MRNFVGASTTDSPLPHSTIGISFQSMGSRRGLGFGWRNFLRYLVLLLAIAGIVVSALALKVHYDTGSEPVQHQ